MHENEPSAAVTEEAAVSQPNQAKRPARYVWPSVCAVLAIALIILLIRDASDSGFGGLAGEAEGVKITKQDLYEELLDRFEQMGYTPAELVDTMITDRLVMAEIEKANITVSEEELEAEIDALIASFGSREYFEMALAQYGYTEDSLKEELKLQLQLEKIIEPMIDAREETIRAYYEDHLDYFAITPEQVRASHILLETKEEAESVLQQLNNGADFAELARTLSQDPGSRDAGGDLDYFERGVMHFEFEEAAFALEKGETSGVVESPSGFHIIRVTDRRAAEVPAYDEIKDEVKSAYMSEQIQEKTAEWIESIREKAVIRNYLAE